MRLPNIAGLIQAWRDHRLPVIVNRHVSSRPGTKRIAGRCSASEIAAASAASFAMLIRDAIRSDLDAINAVTLAAKASWGYTHDQLDAWRESLMTSEQSLDLMPTLVALEGGALVGIVQVDPNSTPWELVSCWIDPGHMRRGIGRTLVREMAARMAAVGQQFLHIDSDPNAEPFYLALGATRIAEVPAPIPGAPQRVRPQLRLATSVA
ncbi:GNAT family N-acetyltransferase [Rubrivivax gelatinosus]|nr:GNAT family N-acetyltransferase [Rubrivivax gelatinosus]